MNINHVAIWAEDIELLSDFYARYFNVAVGPSYHNPVKRLTTCFLTFPGGDAKLEIMNEPEIVDRDISRKFKGLCHLAISLGSKDRVDELTEEMRSEGVRILGNPRTTGDGYYESVVLDPEGNIVELTI